MGITVEDAIFQYCIRQLLDEFDGLPLECDGFTRVATYALTRAGVEHETMGGLVRAPGTVVSPHYWIKAGPWTVDYRLRMWAGTHAPHGVFVPPADYIYVGSLAPQLACSPFVFSILTGKS